MRTGGQCLLCSLVRVRRKCKRKHSTMQMPPFSHASLCAKPLEAHLCILHQPQELPLVSTDNLWLRRSVTCPGCLAGEQRGQPGAHLRELLHHCGCYLSRQGRGCKAGQALGGRASGLATGSSDCPPGLGAPGGAEGGTHHSSSRS